MCRSQEGDGVLDVRPSGVEGVDQFVHRHCMAAVGAPLMDNCDLEALSRATFCGFRHDPAPREADGDGENE